MSEELQSQELVIINEQISQELVKQNVTQAVIGELKERYAGLKISGIEDKETYLIVKEGRKKCKEVRVMAKKICEKGREKAVAEQKAWVKAQKDVTDEILGIEDPLEEQEKAYEAAVAKDKEDRKRRQEEQLVMRQQILTNMGALYSDGSFHLGEVEFELSVVKESEPDIWEESILPKFKEEYEKVEAERIEQERIKQEREAEMKRQQDELEKKKKELEQKEAELKLAQEEQERLLREENERKEKAAKALIEKRTKFRSDELTTLGLLFHPTSESFTYEDVNVHWEEVVKLSDLEWDALTVRVAPIVFEIKEAARKKKEAEIEAQKEAERKMVLGQSRLKALKELGRVPVDTTAISLSDLSEEEYDALYANEKREYEAAKRKMWEAEQEEKRQLEEVKRQQELEISGDKVKWAEVMKQFEAITLYVMISSQYKKKMGILREKLEEIKAL